MLNVLPFVLDFVSVAVLFYASVMLIYIIYKHFKGMNVPTFWSYLVAGFYMLSFYNFFSSLEQTETVAIISSVIKLIAWSLMFIGVYEFYARVKKSKNYEKIK